MSYTFPEPGEDNPSPEVQAEDKIEARISDLEFENKANLGYAIARLVENWQRQGGSTITALGVLDYVAFQTKRDFSNWGSPSDD
jgi:hypothetical protein